MASDAPSLATDELSQREEELIRSAYRVIALQGGHRLSLQDIATEAGVSKGLVLYHFKSKERLFLLTMRWALARTARRIRERIAGVSDPREVVTALVDAVFVDPDRNHEFTLLYLDLVEHAARVPSFGELSTMTREIINGLYAEVIASGVEAGVFDVADVDEAAAAMRAHIEGTLLTWLQDDWRSTHARYRDRCETGLLRLLGAT
ncbi:MAG TPA: TetR family transcriptional regulator [Euzebyales bacterium]|nr:TetR family transcriptional regulator [Euzebyales bacterium]